MEHAEAQIPQNRDPFQRLDVRMQITDLDAYFFEVIGQIFGHLLGERRDEHPLVALDTRMDLADQVVDLPFGLAHFDNRVEQAGRTDDLFHHRRAVLDLVRSRSRRDIDQLIGFLFELVELQRTVVERRRQTESVIDQHVLARLVAVVHGADLRQRHVGFVDHDQHVVREIIHQRIRRRAAFAERQRSGVVLDAGTEPDFFHHLDIVPGTLLQPLRFEQLALFLEDRKAFFKLALDILDRHPHLLFAGDEVGRREDRDMLAFADDLAGQHVDLADPFDLVAEQFDADRMFFARSREDLDHVSPHPERAAHEVDIVALILDVHQTRQDALTRLLHADAQRQQQVAVLFRRTEAVDAGHARHDHDVAPLEQRTGRGVAKPVDLFVDAGIFLDVRIGRRNISFRLEIIIVADEIVDGVVREELFEFAGELRRQRLVVGDDERGTVQLRDRLRDGERLARSGRSEQRLVPFAFEHPFDQLFDRARLVALRREFRDDLERLVADYNIAHWPYFTLIV